MCLTITEKTKKVAEEDIKCYKMVECSTEKLYTFYQSTPVKIGRTYRSSIKIVDDPYYAGCMVHKALHSFRYLKDVHRTIRRFAYRNVKIIECVIPKGSTYYVGDFEGCGECYASSAITYVKEIK